MFGREATLMTAQGPPRRVILWRACKNLKVGAGLSGSGQKWDFGQNGHSERDGGCEPTHNHYANTSQRPDARNACVSRCRLELRRYTFLSGPRKRGLDRGSGRAIRARQCSPPSCQTGKQRVGTRACPRSPALLVTRPGLASRTLHESKGAA